MSHFTDGYTTGQLASEVKSEQSEEEEETSPPEPPHTGGIIYSAVVSNEDTPHSSFSTGELPLTVFTCIVGVILKF